MSLESQIADLVTTTNGLITAFNSKKASIDSAVAAAIAAVPETAKTFYVDQVAGLDTNPGTLAAPLQTINKAIAMTPSSGSCTVQLLSDYEWGSSIAVTCGFLAVLGYNQTRLLKPKYFNGIDLVQYLGCFNLNAPCVGIEIRACGIAFPSKAGLVSKPTRSRITSLVRTNSGSYVPAVVSVTLIGLTVTKADDFVGNLIGLSNSCVCLNCSSVVFPGDFAGFYISDIAAGVDPKSTPHVLTNLTSL